MKIGMIVAMDKELKQLRPLFPEDTHFAVDDVQGEWLMPLHTAGTTEGGIYLSRATEVEYTLAHRTGYDGGFVDLDARRLGNDTVAGQTHAALVAQCHTGCGPLRLGR